MAGSLEKHPLLNRILLLLPPSIGLAFALGALWGMNALPIDDAYILAKYATNLANGAGFAFNPGETSFGSTSFLFPIIVSAIMKIAGVSYMMPALAVGMASFIALISLCEWWVLKETSSTPITIFAGLLIAVSPMGYMNASSGMESMTYALTLIGALAFYRKFSLKQPMALGILSAATFLLRPEGIYLLIVIPGLEIISAMINKRRVNFVALALFVIGFMLPALPYLMFVKVHTGGFMPTTYAGKIISTDPAMHRSLIMDVFFGFNYIFKGAWRVSASFGIVAPLLWTTALLWITTQIARFMNGNFVDLPENVSIFINFTLIPLIFIAIFSTHLPIVTFVCVGILLVVLLMLLFAMLKSRPSAGNHTPWNIALLLVLTFPFAYGALFRAGPIFGGYYNRYILPALPVFAIVSCLGLSVISKTFDTDRNKWAKIGFASLMIYTMFLGLLRFPEHRGVYGLEARRNGGIRTQAAKWIASNAPRDAKVLVGYTGLGVVGGLCERHVSDLGALINPDVFPYYAGTPAIGIKRWKKTLRYVVDKGIDYYVTMPILDDPSAKPDGEIGFTEVARFHDDGLQGSFSTITIWKIDRDAVGRSLGN